MRGLLGALPVQPVRRPASALVSSSLVTSPTANKRAPFGLSLATYALQSSIVMASSEVSVTTCP